MPIVGQVGGSVEQWYATWGARGHTPSDRVLAHIRTMRPTTRLWFDVIMPLAVICVLTNGHIRWQRTLLFIAAMILIHISATFLNDVQDAETDRLSNEVLRRTRPIAIGVIPRRLALVEASGMLVVALALVLFVSWELAGYAVALCLLIAQHELPPVRTQSRPILSQVAAVIGILGILFAMVIAVGMADPVRAVPYLLFVAVYMGIAEMLAKDIRDADNDAEGGKQTTAVKFGAAAATRMAMGAYLVATALWVWFVIARFEEGGRLARLCLVTGIGVLIVWIAATGIATRRLESGYSKVVARGVHRGSVITLTVVNLLVIAGFLAG
jgi:4-hydroxybenzoate polyprenyltransferase